MKPRIMFAPVSMGGQGIMLAETLRDRGYETCSVEYVPTFLGYNADCVSPGDSVEEVTKFAGEMFTKAQDYDVIVFDFGCSFYTMPFWNRQLGNNKSMFWDIEELRDKDKIIFMMFHGSDIRTMSELYAHYWDFNNITMPDAPSQRTD